MRLIALGIEEKILLLFSLKSKRLERKARPLGNALFISITKLYFRKNNQYPSKAYFLF